MGEIEVCLVDVYADKYKHERIKVKCENLPTVIKYKEEFYLRMYSMDVPNYYARIKYYLDLDKVKDESLEEVLSKE